MSLYKMDISDKTIGAAQDSDSEVLKMILDAQKNNNQIQSQPVQEDQNNNQIQSQPVQEDQNFFQRLLNFVNPFGTPAGAAEPDMTIPNVGTGFNTVLDQSGNIQIVPVESNNNFPFVSMAEFANNNNMISPASVIPNTQSGFATNFPYSTNVQPVKTGITESTAAKQFEEPFIMSGGQKIYVSDVLGMQRAAEKGNVFEQPQGILTQAKDFITQQLPKTLKGGLDTLINFIPGMRFIRGLDKMDTLPYMDRKFIQSAMDQKNQIGSGIYVDPTSGAIKDVGGKNVRSLLGNYAETIDKEYERYEKAINRAKEKYGVGFDGTQFTGTNADIANKMNKVNLGRFNFYKDQKQNKAAQQRQLLDKIAKQVKAGQTAKKGAAMHGDGYKSGDGGNKGYIGSDGADYSSAGKTGAKAGFGYGL